MLVSSMQNFTINSISKLEGNTLVISINDLIDQLDDENNFFITNVELQTFSAAVRFSRLQLTLSHAAKFNKYFSYPKAMVGLFWGGNGSYVGQTVNIAPNLDIMAYQEFALGAAYKVNDFLSIGGRIKYLNGFASINTEKAIGSIHTDEEYYKLTASTDFLIQTAGVPISIGGDDDWINIGEFEPSLFGENRGLAFDLGATLMLGDRLEPFCKCIGHWSDQLERKCNSSIQQWQFRVRRSRYKTNCRR